MSKQNNKAGILFLPLLNWDERRRQDSSAVSVDYALETTQLRVVVLFLAFGCWSPKFLPKAIIIILTLEKKMGNTEETTSWFLESLRHQTISHLKPFQNVWA